jgi:hypothetical protein
MSSSRPTRPSAQEALLAAALELFSRKGPDPPTIGRGCAPSWTPGTPRHRAGHGRLRLPGVPRGAASGHGAGRCCGCATASFPSTTANSSTWSTRLAAGGPPGRRRRRAHSAPYMRAWDAIVGAGGSQPARRLLDAADPADTTAQPDASQPAVALVVVHPALTPLQEAEVRGGAIRGGLEAFGLLHLQPGEPRGQVAPSGRRRARGSGRTRRWWQCVQRMRASASWFAW